MHNEELHNLYASPDIIWVLKLGRLGGRGVSTHGRGEKCTQNFCRKT